jgi:hypothetical protein
MPEAGIDMPACDKHEALHRLGVRVLGAYSSQAWTIVC